ncbi:hypothetical protein, partial [Streptomyces sp. NPDC056049]|uniref:hypothetical protein n=1 Tax=Streptomyces sp. NPDC056049 TaxID=3345693 RepID=UPI0035D7A912
MFTTTRATGSSFASAASRHVRGFARGTFAFRTVSRMSASCSGPSGFSFSLLTAPYLPDGSDSGADGGSPAPPRGAG